MKLIPHTPPKLFQDSSEIDRLRQKIKEIGEAKIETMANKLSLEFVTKGTEQSKSEFTNLVKKAVGVDLKGLLVDSPQMKKRVEQLQEWNASLIKSIHSDYLHKINQIIMQGAMSGTATKDLVSEIARVGSVTESRAKLIARDQTAKLHASINRVQSESIGINSYIWSTSMDERVRATHQANEGKVFRFDKPPAITGNPGDEVNCRCIALPNFAQIGHHSNTKLSEVPTSDKVINPDEYPEINYKNSVISVSTLIFPNVKMSYRHLDKKFKHAEDLDIDVKKKNPHTINQYKKKILDFLNDPETIEYGIYREDKQQKVYYNRKLRTAMVFKDREFVTSFKLKDGSPQMINYLKNGNLR